MTSHNLLGVLVPMSTIARTGEMKGSPAGDCLHGDLIVQQGSVVGMKPPSISACRMVVPRLAETHVHLDKCHTIERLDRVGGDLADAINLQWADKKNWSEADVRARATRGLEELRRAGCGAVRSHVDWGRGSDRSAKPTAWSVLTEIAREAEDMVVQLAALTGIAEIANPDIAERIARDVARDGGVLGGFVLEHPERREGVKAAFAMAEKFGLALDFHVDEGLEPALDGVEMIADMALQQGHEGPVLLGHACALMNATGARLASIADKLARAGISVAALPTTNLYLQDRGGGTPDRRGLTRIRELRAAGVNVVVGTDNVRDAFCPVGRHDPRHALELAILAAHLDPPLGDHLPMITTDARVALGLEPITVDGAKAADLLVFAATSTSEVLSTAPAPRLLSELMSEELA